MQSFEVDSVFKLNDGVLELLFQEYFVNVHLVSATFSHISAVVPLVDPAALPHVQTLCEVQTFTADKVTLCIHWSISSIYA